MLLRPLWPPGRAGAAEPKPAVRESEIVHQDQQVVGGVEVRKRTERGQRGPAPVHVGLRLEQH